MGEYYVFEGGSCERCRSLNGIHFEKVGRAHEQCDCSISCECEAEVITEVSGWSFDGDTAYIQVEIYIECCGSTYHVGSEEYQARLGFYLDDPEEVQERVAEASWDFAIDDGYVCPPMLA